MNFVDFDGITYRLSTPSSKSLLLLSISIKCYPELLKYGAANVLEREYPGLVTTPEPGFDVTLAINLEALPTNPADRGCYKLS